MKKRILGLGTLVVTLGIIGASAGTVLAYQGDLNVKGPNYSPERHEVMQNAFESNNYNVWKDLMQDRGRVTQVINEGNFARFAQAHELVAQGDLDGAKQICQELGLGLRDGSGKTGGGMGMNRGNH